jgi:oxygen-independent coproporphyrinogen-3 oxidase
VYCDFAIAVRKHVPGDDFVATIEREIALRLPPPDGRNGVGETVYFGGGTPSRLAADDIGRLLDVIRSRWRIAGRAEVTIEANPDDVTPDKAAAWRAAGITRVSLGVQSFDDTVLRWMHRTHDAAGAVAAAAALRDAGFDDWSLDLIFALPPELTRSWERDLERAIALGPTHVSCYGLTVEPHTPLLRSRNRGEVHDADEDRYETEFLEADRILGLAGYDHYEVSNYARPGHRARHNGACWRRVPYIGLGPSAHSFDGRTRRWNRREFVAWRTAVAGGDDPLEGSERLSPDAVALEETYLGLRTSEGVPIDDAIRPRFEGLERAGWALFRSDSARLTPAGWLRLDRIVSDLTSVRSR